MKIKFYLKLFTILFTTWFAFMILIFGKKLYTKLKLTNTPQPTNQNIQSSVNNGWVLNYFNQHVSDSIGTKRNLKDARHELCLQQTTSLKDLQKTSIIICFHNEAWSTLLRTVNSVLNNSPSELVDAIILVDDFSNMDHLKEPLRLYYLLESKVKIIRTDKREGLVRARLLGVAEAKSEILTFLDSHCECTTGWLEPLLDRVTRNPTTIACSYIDVISPETFEYLYGDFYDGIKVGSFNWKLIFIWRTLYYHEKKRRKNIIDPVRTPVMPGGIFNINRAFFEKLGTYDRDLEIWGAENLELSFKAWMCGGSLEIVPCSHVGHVYRKKSPYETPDTLNIIRRNMIRMSTVWMDEYSKYYLNNLRNNTIECGNLTSRKALREKLNCNNFKWYLDNIYPELDIPTENWIPTDIYKIFVYCLMIFCVYKYLDRKFSLIVGSQLRL